MVEPTYNFFYYICLFSEKLVGLDGKGGQIKGIIVNLMHILQS